MHTRFWQDTGKRLLGKLDADGMITSQQILKKWDGRLRTVLAQDRDEL
jgi:hypothetical protein